ASARPNDAKKKQRVSARDAVRAAVHPLEGPRDGLAGAGAVEKGPEAARLGVGGGVGGVRPAGPNTRLQSALRGYSSPGEKKIAFAVLGLRKHGDNIRDGMVIGIDLKGEQIVKEKKVPGL